MAGTYLLGVPNIEAQCAQIGAARAILDGLEHLATPAKGIGRSRIKDDTSHGYLPRKAQIGENTIQNRKINDFGEAAATYLGNVTLTVPKVYHRSRKPASHVVGMSRERPPAAFEKRGSID
jgi:hypothetical protein